MNIRHAVRSDAPALAGIERVSYPPAEGASEENIVRRLAVFPDCFWILEEEGKIRAFVNGMATNEENLSDEMYEDAAMHDPKGKWLMIFSVVTAPDSRGRGCASRVMERVIADAGERGYRGIVLTCKEGLLGFYAALGFVNEGVSGSVHGGAVWYQMRRVISR